MYPQKTALVHRTGSQQKVGYRIDRFQVWPIRVERPDRGSVTATQVCGTCRKELQFSVTSLRKRTTLKWISAAVAVIALAGFLATVVYFVNAPDSDVQTSRPPDWLLLLGIPFAPIVALSAFTIARISDGVRLKGWNSVHGVKRVRPRTVAAPNGRPPGPARR